MSNTLYNVKERKCCKCGQDLVLGNFNGRYYDDKGIWDRKSWLCNKCRCKDFNDKTRKPLMKSRTGRLSIDSSTGIGLIGEGVFIKVRGAKNCNILKDNLDLEYDCFDDKYGKTQIKTRGMVLVCRINRSEYRWCFSNIRSENYDTIVLFCIDKFRKKIDKIYIIPSEYVNGVSITIYERLLSRSSRWEEFRLHDISAYNDAYQNIMSYIGDRKYIGIEDIKKWLNNGRDNIGETR